MRKPIEMYRRECAGNPELGVKPFTAIGVSFDGSGSTIALGYRSEDGDTTSVFSYEHFKAETLDDAERWLLEQAVEPLLEITAFVDAVRRGNRASGATNA